MLKNISKHVILGRALTVAIALSDLISLIEVIFAPIPKRFFVTFFTIRLLFFVFAYLFSYVRKTKSYYFPAFSEMSDQFYWRIIFFVYTAFKAVFINEFIKVSPMVTLISYNFAVMVIGSVLIIFQGMAGTREQHLTRQRRIYKLIREAKLTKEEFQALQLTLIDRGKEHAKGNRPFLSRLMNVLIAIIIGSFMAAYASNIADFIQKHWFSFPNIFPPY